MSFQAQVSCTKCSGKAQAGTTALLRYIMDRFPLTGSLGIYNCRTVAGSSTMSQHSCGRAGDSKIPTKGTVPIVSVGNPVVTFLIKYSTQFGIVQVIYNRIIYDAKTPGGRKYGGVHPHNDHVHWAQTPTKATSLTYQGIVAIAGAAGQTTGDDMLGFDIGKIGAPPVSGQRSASLQLMLNDRGASPALVADGDAGDKTRQELIDFQKKMGIGTPELNSGVIGAYTNAALYKPVPAGAGGTVDQTARTAAAAAQTTANQAKTAAATAQTTATAAKTSADKANSVLTAIDKAIPG